MKSINEIYEIIEKESIIYEETNLKNMNSKGVYLKVKDLPPIIAIESSIVKFTSLYISILAEELGHHFTTTGDLLEISNNYSDKIVKSKKENISRRWASNFLISDDEFVQALLKCISNKYELCEHFNITDEILEKKIESILRDEKKYLEIKEIFKSYDVQYNSCNI